MSNNVRYQFYHERVKLRKRYRGMYRVCPKCGVTLDWEHPYLPNSAEIDEIVPISKLPRELRGRAAVDERNTQVLCRKCNKLKGNRLPPPVVAEEQPPVNTPRKWL